MARKIRNKPAIAISGVRKMHRDASLIIIACEGEKTEAQYLSFSCFQNSTLTARSLHLLSGAKGGEERRKDDLPKGDADALSPQ